MTNHSKDYYAVLGIKPEATAEEIRQAYRYGASVFHPDRIDQQERPDEWQNAKRVMAEINEAYEVLADESRRRQYDSTRQRRPRRATSHREASAATSEHHGDPPRQASTTTPHVDLSGFRAGRAAYADLPLLVRNKLRQLQREPDAHSVFHVSDHSVVFNLVGLAIAVGWFIYLFAGVHSVLWSGGGVFWRLCGTITASLLVAYNCMRIVQWCRATIRPAFYITPTYIVETDFDFVRFYPVWTGVVSRRG